MAFYDFFRNLFNIPSTNEGLNEGLNDRQNFSNGNEREDSNFWGPHADQYEEMWRDAHENNRPEDSLRNFNVFTDPLEMHRYFEQQMNEVLKSFGGLFGANTFGFSEMQPPAIEQPSSPEAGGGGGTLRNRFLKPGYENKSDDTTKRDHVLDARTINAGDLDEILKEKTTPPQRDDGVVAPYQRQSLLPKIRSFGQSISSKTIRRADGSIEVHKTIRDSAGNEEEVVTRQIGDKQYTITVRTDKEGRQEKCEDLVNMDEKDLPKFRDYWSRGNNNNNSNNNIRMDVTDDVNRLFPYFDKFFK